MAFPITILVPEIKKKAHITMQGEMFDFSSEHSMCANNRTLKRKPSNTSYINQQF